VAKQYRGCSGRHFVRNGYYYVRNGPGKKAVKEREIRRVVGSHTSLWSAEVVLFAACIIGKTRGEQITVALDLGRDLIIALLVAIIIVLSTSLTGKMKWTRSPGALGGRPEMPPHGAPDEHPETPPNIAPDEQPETQADGALDEKRKSEGVSLSRHYMFQADQGEQNLTKASEPTNTS
jgi:hypothetical protein